MPLGNLDRYIVIQNFTEAENTYGEPIKTWATYATIWGEKIEEDGGETIRENQIESKQRITWKVRYNSGITNEMRIYFNSVYYNIENITEVGRSAYLMLKTYKVDG